MPRPLRRLRRSIPDNLDPLVDTLSNVVGILVVVIALTQLELGDALARVVVSGKAQAAQESADAERLPARQKAQDARRLALLDRTDSSPKAAAQLAQELLEKLEDVTPKESRRAIAEQAPSLETSGPEETDGAQLARRKMELEEARTSLEERTTHLEQLRKVPPHLVARLPDPQKERGYVSWILVRGGRVFLVDREALYDEGSRALQRLLGPAIQRGLRPDEFESAALYLRKHSAGVDGFQWRLKIEPAVRVALEWPAEDRGLMPGQLEVNREWQSWLARRNPEQDFIQFHVWNDSFEAYLETRRTIEAAGFRGGWIGREADEEIELVLSFGARPSREQVIEVD